MDKKKSSKNMINILIILVLSIVVVFFFVKDDFNGVVDVLGKAQWSFVVLALGFFSLMYIFDALILLVLTRKTKKDYTFKEAMSVAMVGSFFSAITPSATGGQFSQAIVYEKQGVPVEKSGSILILNFIAYQVVIVLFCFVTIFFRPQDGLNFVELFGYKINFLILVFVGFIINILGIFGVLFLAYFKGVQKFVKWICKLLFKMHVVKDLDKTIEKVDNKIYKLRCELKDVKGNIRYFITACLLYVVRYGIYFAIPFFAALALNVPLRPRDFFIAIILSSYVHLIASFIPIPGASGGAEFFFGMMFSNYFGDPTLLASGMLIWRFVTFYFGLIIGFFVVFNFNHKLSCNLFTEINDNYRWFVVNRKYAYKERKGIKEECSNNVE